MFKPAHFTTYLGRFFLMLKERVRLTQDGRQALSSGRYNLFLPTQAPLSDVKVFGIYLLSCSPSLAH